MRSKGLIISDAKSIILSGASATDTLDLGLAGLAVGTLLKVKAMLTTAIVGATAKIAITVASSATEGGTYVTHGTLAATVGTTLSVGDLLIDMILPAACEKWVKITYTASVAAITAGAVDAWVEPQV